MQIRYSGYSFTANAAELRIAKESLRTQAGYEYAIRERWDIRGRLEGANQAAITTAIMALELALVDGGASLGLFEDAGNPSAHVVYAANTLAGIRVVQRPIYDDSRGAQYATYRDFSCAFEWEYHAENIGLLAWQETVQISGGGPLVAHVQTLVGLPQKQQLAETSPYRASQSGSAMGHFSYPLPPAPLWPADLAKEAEIMRRSPKMWGGVLVEWGIEWRYDFESAYPLLGVPNPQPYP